MESIVHSLVHRDPQWGIPKRPVCDSPSLAEGFLAQCESRQLPSYLHTLHITVPDKSLRWVSSTRVFGFGRTSRRNRGHRTRHPGWTQNMLWQVLLTWKPGKLIQSFQVVTMCCQRWPQKLRKQRLTSRDWKEWITWRWAWQIWAWSKTWRAGSLGSGCLQARTGGRWRTGKQQQGHPGVPIHHFTAKNENESFEGKCKEKQFFRKMSKGRRRQKLTMLTISFLFAVCSFPY